MPLPWGATPRWRGTDTRPLCGGLAAKLGAARASLADLERKWDKLAAKGLLLKNDAAEMAGKIARGGAERDGLSAELDSIGMSLADVLRECNGLATDKLSLQS